MTSIKQHFLSKLHQLWILGAVLLALSWSATAMAHGKYMPWPVTEVQWRQVKTLHGTATQPGMNVPALYVFFDPDCPWCARLWQTKLSHGPFKDVPALWVPVTYLTPNSTGKAAALLRQGNKAGLERDFGQYDFVKHTGGIQPVQPSDSEREALGQAKALWLQLGGVTPMFVYRTKAGEALVYMGLPGNPAFIDSMVNTLASSRLGDYSE